MRNIRPLTLMMGLCLAVSCRAVPDPEGSAVHPGLLDVIPPVHIELPDTVTAGQPFTARVRTYGLSGCYRLERTETSVSGSRADIRTFDRNVASADMMCTANIPEFMHEASLTLSVPGPATVRIHGARISDRSALVIERQVFVRQ